MALISFEKAAELLKEMDNILILCHANPDGDTLGSGFALCRALKAIGKKARVDCSSEIPSKFSYITEGIFNESFEAENFVAVDVADIRLLGDNYAKEYENKIKLNIDHHGSNTMFAENTLLDSSAAAACEVVYELICTLGVEVNKAIADCIYTGISTDTGCFRFTNTTAKTHIIASKVMEKGADIEKINRLMFETKSRSYMRLEKLALDTLKMYFDGRCAVLTIMQDMYEKSGAKESDTDAICAIPRQIEGVQIGASIKQKDEKRFKISVRTHAPYDAAKICGAMGGGGHPRAAGCEIFGSLDDVLDELLKTVEANLED